MKIVGEKLGAWALDDTDNDSRDLFGRSAYNRFYYAAFLVTREMLGELNPGWKHTPHAEIPVLLGSAIKKPVKSALKKSVRNRVVSKAEERKLLNKLTVSSSELANLLKEAYEIRVIADYKPETRLYVERNIISLDGCKLNTATGWSSRASAYCKTIRRVWGDCGLA